MRRLLPLALMLWPGLLSAATLRSVAGPQTAMGLHAFVAALPPAYLKPVSDYLSSADRTATQLDQDLAAGPNGHAQAHQVAAALLDADMDAMTAARRVGELEAVLTTRLSGKTLLPLNRAASELRRQLADDQRALLDARMSAVADALGRGRSAEDLPSAAAFAGELNSGSELIQLKELRSLSGERLHQALADMSAIGREMGLGQIPARMLLELMELDRDMGFSRVALGPDGRVRAFVLASYDPQQMLVGVELSGSRHQHRAALEAPLLRGLAARAVSLGIDLVALRARRSETPGYEKLGFENLAPPSHPEASLLAPARVLAGAAASLPPPRPDAAGEMLGRSRPAILKTMLDYGGDIGHKALEAVIGLVMRRTPLSDGAGLPFYAGPRLRQAYEGLFEFVEKDAAGDAFLRTIFKDYVDQRIEAGRRGRFTEYRWPVPDMPGGEYWDLASGPNAGDWMLAGLDERFHYRFFDKSPISTVLLEEVAAGARAAGLVKASVSVERADVLALEKPSAPLAAVRSKNVHNYVTGGAQAVMKTADWIAPGGALILQSHGRHRENEIAAYGAFVDGLLAQGWTFRYTPAKDPRGALDVDTWMLTKPVGRASPDPASIAAFAAHKRSVREQARYGGGIEDLLAALMGGRR